MLMAMTLSVFSPPPPDAFPTNALAIACKPSIEKVVRMTQIAMCCFWGPLSWLKAALEVLQRFGVAAAFILAVAACY